MTIYKTILYEVSDNVAVITMNRPESLNAISLEMLDDLLHALFECTQDERVRVIVLTGRGRAFSSGGDINIMKDFLDKDVGAFMTEWITRVHLLEMQIRTVPKPVVAAINGIASGQGFNLALACDIRIAAESAQFNQSFVNLGLTSEGTYFLPRMVGVSKATELCFTGDAIDAREAERLGIINRVVPEADLYNEVHAFAQRLGRGPTAALARIKWLINASYRNPLDTHLQQECKLIAETAGTQDFREGVLAFFEKRNPNFTGR
ncbi:MAG: enoyl-CoA hydratase [Acidobacteria bacterium]|nr:enoyl-CoA hydratase [Acidobacteriota bacterium]MBI3658583.1 enoyl-CoA hydratase [Acidobacteriota bacterium]